MKEEEESESIYSFWELFLLLNSLRRLINLLSGKIKKKKPILSFVHIEQISSFSFCLSYHG